MVEIRNVTSAYIRHWNTVTLRTRVPYRVQTIRNFAPLPCEEFVRSQRARHASSPMKAFIFQTRLGQYRRRISGRNKTKTENGCQEHSFATIRKGIIETRNTTIFTQTVQNKISKNIPVSLLFSVFPLVSLQELSSRRLSLAFSLVDD